MKQKLVVEVDMHDAKSRSKAMKIAVGLPGVISATIEADKNQLTVVGDGVDPVNLTTLLRKRMSSKIDRLFCISCVCSELVSVTPVDEKKKEEEKKPEPIVAWPIQYYPTVALPYYCCRNDNCLIM
ncbi:heavy metal-associated isoprenylated plant protein 47-like protein [Cinnamomum micranthum f. kanehirae]|uniref:Heavy metal-associated isoprenylated plant protein 47-like protein n=1 Tax=Cinnamomum micranthum f. kanehirae TaxID=337451 RepID=A0A443P281_9MAGN|nr:heavy metal-associated isoprenylated plant protein 47-like protein [Cinnamomum micranthum f. kanehirae]